MRKSGNLIASFCLVVFFLLTVSGTAWSTDSPPVEPSPSEQNKAQTEQNPLLTQAPDPKSEATMSDAKSETNVEPADVAPYESNPVAKNAVGRSISLFTERIKEKFSLWLARSGKYLDLMKEIMRANNIPEDIAFLPLIESGFSTHAYSVAKAVGPWQFIAATGKRYGLKIDWWRDERKDPVKSTEAAANYLKDLYGMFGSWNLAMAAYNAGEGKILKALNRSKSDDYWDLLSTKHIRDETKEYVPKFIAAKMIADNPESFGFENLNYHAPLAYDEVALEKPVDLDVVARCAGVGVDAIKELNPELRRWSTPPNVPSYTVRIPAGKKDLFQKNLGAIPEKERFTIVTYVVKKGDTIRKISNKAGVPVNVILELNDGMKPVRAGEKIYLPPKDKFFMDRDDKAMVKKATLKKTKKSRGKLGGKKVLVTSLPKKDVYVNN